MAGIGNTVETDLVGEVVEVFSTKSRTCQMRGRVRAVTPLLSKDDAVGVCLWIEMPDKECLDASFHYHGGHGAIGDILTVSITANRSYDSDWFHIHLIKEPG